MELATDSITEKIESKLKADLQHVSESMYSIENRLHNLETLPDLQAERSQGAVSQASSEAADRAYALQLQMAEETQNISKSIIALQSRIHSMESLGIQIKKPDQLGEKPNLPTSISSRTFQAPKQLTERATSSEHRFLFDDEEESGGSMRMRNIRRDSAVDRIEEDQIQ